MALQKFDEDNCGYEPNIGLVASTVASMGAAGKNANRVYLLVQNNSNGNIYITFNDQIPTSGNGVTIRPDEAWEPRKVPNGAVNVLAEIDNSAAVIVQGSSIEVGAA